MSTTLDAVLSSWSSQPWLAAALLLWAAIYLRGWRMLRRRDEARWQWAKAAAFMAGLGSIYLSLASPIETFASLVLVVHMVQHLVLMIVAPMLILQGEPFLPLLRGLPGEIRRYWIVPLLRWPPLAKIAGVMVRPATAWTVFMLATWIWHMPGPYELALSSDAWHLVQHFCFFTAGLIFWYPVIQPFPARVVWSQWILIPYLLLADVQNTLLAAWFTFSDRVWYLHYLQVPRLGGFSALDDQAAAGVTMWVPGSVAFLLPLAWIGVGLLQNRKPEVERRKATLRSRSNSHPACSSPHSSRQQLDLLRVPILGAALRWQGTRRIVQLAVLLVVVAVVVDGLFGPQVAAMNLAGIVPWIHWRGLVILGLMVLGNVFCFACPFTLPRTVARKWFASAAQRTWPRWLRGKWLAAGLMVLFLWSYEAFSLWNSPWLTAWIAIFYFAGALIVDSVFSGAAFCKYMCPIGQFNFVQSLVSPWEVRVREPAACTSCRTHDCIQGRGASPGCQLQLFQPRKVGNLDCTFCLDCVQACPHENVGVLAVAPLTSIWRDGPRSGIGRLSRRTDYAVLAMVLVFGAFANAAGMVGPVVDWENQISGAWGLPSTFLVTTVFYALTLFVVPLLLISAAALASYHSMRMARFPFPTSRANPRSFSEFTCRFTWSLIPLGFAMWLAHYSYHFFTSCDTIVPVAQRFAADFHLAALGLPDWVCSCCRPAPDWLLEAELLMLDIGMLAAMYCTWRIGSSLAGGWQVKADHAHSSPNPWQVIKIIWPWAVLIVALFATGIWILLEPMQMRGTLPGG